MVVQESEDIKKEVILIGVGDVIVVVKDEKQNVIKDEVEEEEQQAENIKIIF
jgi:hypothetical protein